MPQIDDVKIFAGAKMQRDKHLSYLEKNEFYEINNMRCNTSEEDDVGVGEAILGNELVSNPDLPDGSFKVIGSTVDGENHYIYYFIYDGSTAKNHGIYRYDADNKSIAAIFIDPILNFQETHPVAANVIGDLLYFTDNYEDPSNPFGDFNPPRKLNTYKAYNTINKVWYDVLKTWAAGTSYTTNDYVYYSGKIYRVKYSHTSTAQIPPDLDTTEIKYAYYEDYDVNEFYLEINAQILDRIKYPPSYPIGVLDNRAAVTPGGDSVLIISGYATDPAIYDNNLHGTSFQFSYRYKYDDNEESAWSAISPAFYNPKSVSANGNFILDSTVDNCIVFNVDVGSVEVVRVDLAVRLGNNGNWRIFDRLYKYDEDGTLSDDVPLSGDYTYFFYNTKIGEGLDQEDVIRPFDYVPQISKAQDLAEKNKLVDGNYIEGYDNVDVDITVDKHYDKVDVGSASSPISVTPVLNPPGGSMPASYRYVRVEFTGASPGALFLLSLSVYFWQTGMTAPVWGGSYPVGNTFQQVFTCGPDTSNNDVAEYYRGWWQAIVNTYYAEYWSDYYVIDNVLYICWQQYPQPDVTLNHYILNGYGTRYDTISTYNTWKSGSWVELGLVYYDRAGRHGGVNVCDGSSIYLPNIIQAYKDNLYTGEDFAHRTYLEGQISHVPPMWAEYYQWVVASKASKYYNFFAVDFDDIIYYPSKKEYWIPFNKDIDSSSETYPHMNVGYYNYEKGDRLRLVGYKPSRQRPDDNFKYMSEYSIDVEIRSAEYPDTGLTNGGFLKDSDSATWGDSAYILDENGNKVRDVGQQYIIISLAEYDVDLSPFEILLFEIYKPPKDVSDDDTKLFYEIGHKYQIIAPGSSKRRHDGGQASQIINYATGQTERPAKTFFNRGDAYIITRFSSGAGIGSFPVESRSYSDWFDSQIWDIGRTNIIDRNALRQRYDSNLRHSGSYIENSKINNLSRVKAEDYMALSGKYGAITLVHEVGYTLKVRQVLKSTSVYVGREGFTQATEGAEDLTAESNKTLGTSMPSRSIYGCSDPTSYVSSGKYEYFIDIINGVAVRDASNGMIPISRYGMEDWFKDKCRYLLEDCSSYEIFSGYDPYFEEVYFSFIAREKGEDPTIETIVFSERDNGWSMFVDLWDGTVNSIMSGYETVNTQMVSFLNGGLWLHNRGDVNKFYGTQYYPSFIYYANTAYQFVKNFRSITEYADTAWAAPTAGDISIESNTTYDRGMISLLKKGIFADREGVFYAPFGKNMITSGTTPSFGDYANGDDLRGKALKIKLTNDLTGSSRISSVVVRSNVSKKSGVKS